jgi:catechol 2,3-dioxygenase-like lactoylglutathione lyase family enzyme
VLRLAWLGVRARDQTAMVGFLRDVMGLRVAFEEPTTTELALPNDDRIQVFGSGDRYFEFFEEHATGPVALFEVDDVQQAKAELELSGIELVGAVESDTRWTWVHFRAPDGNLYAVASRRPC